jgi:hypothetical protein
MQAEAAVRPATGSLSRSSIEERKEGRRKEEMRKDEETSRFTFLSITIYMACV